MKATDMFRGEAPNAGLVDRAVRAKEVAVRTFIAAGAAVEAASPELKAKLRLKQQGGTADGAQPGDGVPSNPMTVLDAKGSTPPGASVGRFARLVEPLSPPAFVDTYYAAKRPVLFRGDDRRFAPLVGWEDLNSLVSIDLLRPRLKLVRDGVPIPLYHCEVPDYGFGWRPDRDGLNSLDIQRLNALLSQGTTLILDGIEDVHPPIRQLADDMEVLLGGYVGINLYASWHATRGFDTHWDGHDILVLQVAGCKRWRIFGETRRFPMHKDVVPNSKAPTDAIWTETLHPGDVLYIPRGWWHDARVEDSAAEKGVGSLHLTCGVHACTGAGLLEWLKGKLAHHELFRRDLPLYLSEEKSRTHFAALRELIVSALDEDVTRQLQDHLHGVWSQRRGEAIGSYIEPWKSPDWGECVLRLRGAPCATVAPDAATGAINLKAGGYTWSLDPTCTDLIVPLVESGGMSVGDVKAIAPDRFPADFVDDFARLLIEKGITHAVFPEH